MSTMLEDPQRAHKELSTIHANSEGAVWGSKMTHATLALPAHIRPGEDGDALREALARADNAVSLVDSVGLATRLSGAMRTLAIPSTQLALFVGFLRHCGVLPKEQDYSEDQERLQKCAFIAQRAFGLDLAYEWRLHTYGAFSSFLAADYAELAVKGLQADFGEIAALDEVPGYRELAGSQDVMPFPTTRFEAGRFVSLVSGRPIEWLRLASAVVHEKGSFPDGLLLERVSGILADYDRGLGRQVMRDLEASRPPAWGACAPEGGRGP
ncbi:MAG: hypothetical protein OXU25_04360 [Thaumarchaeota archaeon]|nr:hypothetical protein [Nitrososphaerota archaeon]